MHTNHDEAHQKLGYLARCVHSTAALARALLLRGPRAVQWRGVLFAWFLSWTDLHPLDGLLGSGGLLLGKLWSACSVQWRHAAQCLSRSLRCQEPYVVLDQYEDRLRRSLARSGQLSGALFTVSVLPGHSKRGSAHAHAPRMPGVSCLFYQPWWPLEFAKVIWSGPCCCSPAWALLSPCPIGCLLSGWLAGWLDAEKTPCRERPVG